MLYAWMEANEPYAGLLRWEAHLEGTAMLGDPLRVWTGSPVAFLHVEKTGGSSSIEAMVPCFHPLQIDPDPQRTCPPHVLTPILSLAVPAIQRHALVWGHYDLPSLRRLGAKCFNFTLLREPQARLLSLYRFWRSTLREGEEGAPASPGVIAARSLSLLDFLRHPDLVVRNAIDNCYVRRLTGLYATGDGADPVAEDPEGALTQALRGPRRLARQIASSRCKGQSLEALVGLWHLSKSSRIVCWFEAHDVGEFGHAVGVAVPVIEFPPIQIASF